MGYKVVSEHAADKVLKLSYLKQSGTSQPSRLGRSCFHTEACLSLLSLPKVRIDDHRSSLFKCFKLCLIDLHLLTAP